MILTESEFRGVPEEVMAEVDAMIVADFAEQGVELQFNKDGTVSKTPIDREEKARQNVSRCAGPIGKTVSLSYERPEGV